MILMNNNFEYKVERVKTDKNGNYIILDVNIGSLGSLLLNTRPIGPSVTKHI